MKTRYIAFLIAFVAFIVRFLRIGAIENDHYVYLARAHQVLHGDWPVRNFADPGMPLAYLLSAAAAAIAGPTLLVDAALSASLFAVAVAITYYLVRRASGSLVIAVIAIALVLAVPPRLYNSSKVLVPVVATLLAWAFVDRPSVRRAAALGAWAGVAFLFRHDYAIYIACATLAMLVMLRYGSSTAEPIKAAAVYAAAALAVMTPWLVYVHLQIGLGEYLASALRFSQAEGTRTIAPWPAVFYLTAAIPVAALVVGIRGTRHLSIGHIVFATVVVGASELVLLRDAPAARLPDVAAPTAVVAAIIAGRFKMGTRKPDTAPPILLTSALITAVGIALFLTRASMMPATPEVTGRWSQVTGRLRSASPEIMPDPQRAPLVQLIAGCVGPEERVLIGGFAPELPVLARRAFAGGLPDWIRGYYEDPRDIRQAHAQLAREEVALAVMLDGGDAFSASWPSIAQELHNRGLARYDVRLVSGPVEVWLRPVTPRDGPSSLPCATPR